MYSFCGSDVTIDWVSSPLRPGEIALVSGGGFSDGQIVTLVPSQGPAVNISSFDVSVAGLKFTVPQTGSDDHSLMAYDMFIGDSGKLQINTPEVWAQ